VLVNGLLLVCQKSDSAMATHLLQVILMVEFNAPMWHHPLARGHCVTPSACGPRGACVAWLGGAQVASLGGLGVASGPRPPVQKAGGILWVPSVQTPMLPRQ